MADTALNTWSVRKSGFVGVKVFDYYYSKVSGTLSSDTITVTYVGSTFYSVVAFALSGVVSSSQFDSNGSLPASAGASTVTYSTSNAADFLLSYSALGSSTGTAQSGWTLISGSGVNFMVAQYKLVTAIQTSQSVGNGGGSGLSTLADGIKSS